MIRTRLTLTPRTGQTESVLELYRRRDVLARSLAVPGCVEVEISIPDRLQPGDERIEVAALWVDESAYEQWLRDPGRAADVAALRELLVAQTGAIGATEISRVAARNTRDDSCRADGSTE